MKYQVRTRHGQQFEGAFIVGYSVMANGALEAAQKRFALLCPSSAAEVDALMVQTESGGDPFVFLVGTAQPVRGVLDPRLQEIA
jgi:hypothetical protein